MKFHDEQSVNQGIELEDLYRKKLMEKLKGDYAPELADRIIGTGEMELGGLAKKPVYEELESIPMNDQLRMMGDHFNELPQQEDVDPELDKKLDTFRKLQMLKGQRLG